MTSKAPTGGTTSPINGQFYDGGQFIPDHGAYCGKGKNRVTREEFNRVAALVESTGNTLEYRETTGEFVVVIPGGNLMYRARTLSTIAKAY